MFFFPQNEHLRAQAMKLFEVVTRKEGLEFLAWRKVPVDPGCRGPESPRLHARHLAVLHQKARQGEQGHRV